MTIKEYLSTLTKPELEQLNFILREAKKAGIPRKAMLQLLADNPPELNIIN